MMFLSEREVVEDLINGYGEEITLGELLENIKRHEWFMGRSYDVR